MLVDLPTLLAIVSTLIGVVGVLYAKQQVKHAKEEVELAKEQVRLARLPKPASPEYGLTTDTHVNQSIFGRYEGKSRNNKRTRNGFVAIEEARHTEQFTIARVSGKITIEGTSFLLSNGVAI